MFNYRIIKYITPILFITSCSKIIEIGPPVGYLETTQVFSSEKEANAALMGAYSNIGSQTAALGFGFGSITVYPGVFADELISSRTDEVEFNDGNLLVNTIRSGSLWTEGYKIAYLANVAIEGLSASETINESTKNAFIAEMKVLRAFCYFNLTNLYGDVPYITSSDWKTSAIKGRTNVADIYAEIVTDLNWSVDKLPINYDGQSGARTRINKWVCKALLSRIYLYQGNWNLARTTAKEIFDADFFQLEENIDDVFLAGSREAILQWDMNTTNFPYNATTEGYIFNVAAGRLPRYYANNSVIDDFEANDLRKEKWLKKYEYQGAEYWSPFKYKIGTSQATPGADPVEHYIVFRLAEQYLIAAEAGAQLGEIESAVDALNVIRVRANLDPLEYNITKDELLSIIEHERRIELFAEWGHRFFDLRRWNKLDDVMKNIKPLWSDKSKYWPIPISEIQSNPNLKQNPGY